MNGIDFFLFDSVSPAYLETLFLQCPSIRFIFVYGEPIRSFVVAAVVPHEIVIQQWQSAHPEVQNVLEDRQFRTRIHQEIIKVAQQKKLLVHEIPHGIFLDHQEWTPQNALLTESFKVHD